MATHEDLASACGAPPSTLRSNRSAPSASTPEVRCPHCGRHEAGRHAVTLVKQSAVSQVDSRSMGPATPGAPSAPAPPPAEAARALER
jgi:hypothetical protein